MTRHRLTWLASEDGVAHCHTSAHTTACGAQAVLMRWAWPTVTRCPRCLAAKGAATCPEAGGPHRARAIRGGPPDSRAAKLPGFLRGRDRP